MNLRGIIFDFDGTLADTLPLCIAAFQAAAEPYAGRVLSADEIRATFGPSEEGSVRVLAPADPDGCLDAYVGHYERLHPELAPMPFPGVEALLDDLAGRGVRLGLVTGKGERSLEISMRLHRLARHFDEVRFGCAEGPCKPGNIRSILAAWGLPAEEVAYVGDSPHDVDDSREVGCVAVAAAWASTTDDADLAATNPDLLFTSVETFRGWLAER